VGGNRQRRIQLTVAAVALALVSAGGSAARANPALAPGTAAHQTNLQLVAGIDSEFPIRPGTRALSTSPMLVVTGAPLDLDVSRSGGTVKVRQGGVLLPVRPKSVLQGLPGFFRWKLLGADGSVVASADVDVCPMPGTVFTADAWHFNQLVNLDPANPATPAKSPYPQECGDPLSTHARWGFPNGWGAQFHVQVPDATPPGSYTLDATVNPDGVVREATRDDNHLRIPVEVIDLTSGAFAEQAAAARQRFADRQAAGMPRPGVAAPGAAPGAASGAAPAQVPGVTSDDSARQVDLPDLVPLPSENIATRHSGTADLLRFNSTMTNLGRGRLQVDGFRSGAPDGQMLAYQVLFHNGVEVARRPAGTLVFEADENEWHFDFLARYQLVDAAGTVVASSGKIGFCMADVHQVDAANPGFVTPDFTGFDGCGVAPSQSVREWIDPGWGDEYDQLFSEQALDITNQPNGTYRIQILADPDHKLREATRDNNTSLRTVVLGGQPQARTVTVPPIDGVDTEAAWAAIHRTF